MKGVGSRVPSKTRLVLDQNIRQRGDRQGSQAMNASVRGSRGKGTFPRSEGLRESEGEIATAQAQGRTCCRSGICLKARKRAWDSQKGTAPWRETTALYFAMLCCL